MRYFLCALVLLFFFACSLRQEPPSLQKAWLYKEHLTAAENAENIYKYGSTIEYGFTSASFLDLRPDGKFTSLFAAFDYGNWELKDSSLELTNHLKGQLILDIKHLDRDKMVCVNKRNR